MYISCLLKTTCSSWLMSILTIHMGFSCAYITHRFSLSKHRSVHQIEQEKFSSVDISITINRHSHQWKLKWEKEREREKMNVMYRYMSFDWSRYLCTLFIFSVSFIKCYQRNFKAYVLKFFCSVVRVTDNVNLDLFLFFFSSALSLFSSSCGFLSRFFFLFYALFFFYWRCYSNYFSLPLSLSLSSCSPSKTFTHSITTRIRVILQLRLLCSPRIEAHLTTRTNHTYIYPSENYSRSLFVLFFYSVGWPCDTRWNYFFDTSFSFYPLAYYFFIYSIHSLLPFVVKYR